MSHFNKLFLSSLNIDKLTSMNFKKLKFSKLHIQALRDIANWYGIEFKVIIVKNVMDSAYACMIRDKIVLKIRKDSEVPYVYTLFFHELGHIKNKYTHKYPLFHRYDPLFFNKKERTNFLRTVTRAEFYTEKVGKDLMKCYFPDIPYYAGYTKSSMKIHGPIMIKEYRSYFEFVDKIKSSINNVSSHKK